MLFSVKVSLSLTPTSLRMVLCFLVMLPCLCFMPYYVIQMHSCWILLFPSLLFLVTEVLEHRVLTAVVFPDVLGTEFKTGDQVGFSGLCRQSDFHIYFYRKFSSTFLNKYLFYIISFHMFFSPSKIKYSIISTVFIGRGKQEDIYDDNWQDI